MKLSDRIELVLAFAVPIFCGSSLALILAGYRNGWVDWVVLVVFTGYSIQAGCLQHWYRQAWKESIQREENVPAMTIFYLEIRHDVST